MDIKGSRLARQKQTSKKRTGIVGIAKTAGVAPSTVSRFFNHGQVSAKTRLKIEQAVQQTGYRPDTRAASLRKGSTNRIGIIVPDIGNPAYSSTVHVFHDFLQERGYSLVLGCTYGLVDQEHQQLQYMLHDHVDGIILYTCESPQTQQSNQYLEELRSQKKPVVYVGRQNALLPMDNLTIDNLHGIDKAVRYLHRIGRRHIAFLSGDTSNWAYKQRVDSFKDAMKALKRKVSKKQILAQGQSTVETGTALLPELLNQAPQTDAILCSNDLMAVGAMYAALQMGIKVPEQLAVIGFDDIALASLVRPQLTTIRQPTEQMAQQICKLLIARLGGDDSTARNLLFEPELVIRDSA